MGDDDVELYVEGLSTVVVVSIKSIIIIVGGHFKFIFRAKHRESTTYHLQDNNNMIQ